MPKSRNIDPSFWDDPEIATLTRDERLLLVGMITGCADDEGRMIADAGYLRKTVFGYDDDVTKAQVEKWRDAVICKCRNVKLYSVNKQVYIYFAHWTSYQSIRYIVPSKIPEYAEEYAITPGVTETSSNVPEIAEDFTRVGLGRVEKGRDGLGRVGGTVVPPQPAKEPPVEPRGAAPKAVPTTVKATTIPATFHLTDDMIEWATSKGYDQILNLKEETEEFIAYWSEGEGLGEKRKNWLMVWRTRIKERYERLELMNRRAGARSNGHKPTGTTILTGPQRAREPTPEGFDIVSVDS